MHGGEVEVPWKGRAGAGALCAAILLLVLVVQSGGNRTARASSSADARAVRVEAALAKANLALRMEAALGDSYGGAWFDRSTARLHVGVTSLQSRRAAEALARRAGLGNVVTETTVEATRDELLATQRRWSERLFDRFPPGEVALAILPQRNTVQVELGPGVPPAVVAQLEREAARSEVDVSIDVDTRPPVLQRTARCAKFEKAKAKCDPTIVAGTRITSGAEACSAGPALQLKDRSKETTETFLLTAGHCIRDAGGNGEIWKALNKAGEAKEIGAALEYSVANFDAGVIKVNNPGYWANATQIPVIAAYAWWNPGAESEPEPVIGPLKPTVGTQACVSGQMTGSQCGEITAEKVEAKDAEGTLTKNLVAVNTVVLDGGDSGGPWFSTEAYGRIEGTTVGFFGPEKIAVYQPLEISLAELKTKYQLLDETNEERKKCPMKGECWFEAEKYPVTVTGTSAKGNEVLTTEAGKVECATHLIAESEAGGSIHPTYSSCAAFGFLSATMTTGSGSERCDFALDVTSGSSDSYGAKTSIACSPGTTIKVTAGTCEMTIGSQSASGSTSLSSNTGSSPKTVTIQPSLSGIAYTVVKDGLGCPFSGTGARTGATYVAGSGTQMAATNGEDVWAAAP